MSDNWKRGERIRQFILDNLEHHPTDIIALTSKAFDISRQAVNKHIKRLVNQNALLVPGSTRSKRYFLQPLIKWKHNYPLDETLAEDVVWRTDISKFLRDLPDNVVDIWQYGFTEILNNAIDHSSLRRCGWRCLWRRCINESGRRSPGNDRGGDSPCYRKCYHRRNPSGRWGLCSWQGLIGVGR